MKPSSPQQTHKTTADLIFHQLREGKDALIRARKAKIQREYMIARRTLEATYEDMAPEDLPVDLNRLGRDIEITRDDQISRCIQEIEETHRITREALTSVVSMHPAVYQEPADEAATKRTNAAVKASRHMKHSEVFRVAKFVLSQPKGVTLMEVCSKFGFTSPPAHMGAKKLLAWFSAQGMVSKEGAGKAMRYLGTKKLERIVEEKAQLAEG